MAQHSPRVLNRKSKMISFRMSSEEYEKLRTFCVRKGQRSVSDLARLAVSSVLAAPDKPSLEARLADVEARVVFLTAEIHRLDTLQGVEEPSAMSA